MEKRMQSLYEDVFSTYQQLVATLNWADKQLREHVSDAEFCADMGFVLDELDKLVKDIGVEIRKRRELAELLQGRAYVNATSDDPIRTEHCSATPRVKLQPKIPPKDSPAYAELMKWLGFEQNLNTVRLHWPTLCELVSQRAAEGAKLPPGLKANEMHNPAFTVTYRKRKGVTE